MKKSNLFFLAILLSIFLIPIIETIPTKSTIFMPEIPEPISTATGEDMPNAIEIFGNSYTDIRRFQEKTYFKVWSEADRYLSIDVDHGLGEWATIVNSSKKYVENTSQGYYYISVPQYNPEYLNLDLCFPNYTVTIYTENIHTMDLATEILSGDTQVTFSDNHYYKKYYKVYVEANKYLSVVPCTQTMVYIYDENYTELARNYDWPGPNSNKPAAEVLKTSYQGYYFIEVQKPDLGHRFISPGYKLDFTLTVGIKNPVELSGAEEILTTTTSIAMGDYFTKYVKLYVEENKFLWIKAPINITTVTITNSSLLVPICMNTSDDAGAGYYVILFDKLDKTVSTIPIEIIYATAYSINNATVVTPGLITQAFPYLGIYPVVYYKISVANEKFLGASINISSSYLLTFIQEAGGPGGPFNYIENTTDYGTTTFHIVVGFYEFSIDLFWTGTYQLNITVADSYEITDATTVSVGETAIDLPNGPYPYIYLKISVPSNKFFKVELDNPMLNLDIFAANYSPLTYGFGWMYQIEDTGAGGMYYIRIQMEGIMQIGSYIPTLRIGHTNLRITIDNAFTLISNTALLGNTSGSLDPYKMKKYHIWLLENNYFTINVLPTSDDTSLSMFFSTADTSCATWIESIQYPLKRTYYIADTGYHNITLTGSGDYTLILEFSASLPPFPYNMTLPEDSWATYEIISPIDELTRSFSLMMGSPEPLFDGKITFNITDIDYYGGNYIINDSYLSSNIYYIFFQTLPVFIPVEYDINPSIPRWLFTTPVDVTGLDGSVFSGETSLGTYTFNGTIYNTIVFTGLFNSIPIITASYEINTGVLLSIEVPNWVLGDFDMVYSVTLLATNIEFPAPSENGGPGVIPGFQIVFLIFALFGVSLILLKRTKYID